MKASPIEQRLQTLKKALWEAYARELCVQSGVMAAAGVALMLLFAQYDWVRVALGTGVGIIALAAVVLLVRLRRLHRRIYAAQTRWPAQMAQRLAPELGTAITSAFDFEQALRGTAAVTFSQDLAQAHIASTARNVEQVKFASLLQTRRAPKQRKHAMALGAALVLTLALGFALEHARARLRGFVKDPQGTTLSDVPLAGDIHLTYHYPAYTHLPDREVQGGDGSIQAVVGTEVALSCQSDMPVQSGILRVETPQGGEPHDIPMTVQNERQLAARVAIARDARYHFIFTQRDGDRVEDKHHHPIRAVLDAYPEVFLDTPTGDVELRENQSVDVTWRAQDDFGISDVQLVVDLQDQNAPTLIALPSDDTGHHGGVYHWSLASLRLEPGKEAEFHIAVTDNDAIGGPKKTNSPTRRIVLFSAKKHHEELLQKQHEVLDAWVDWLAAELLAPFGASSQPQDIVQAEVTTQTDLVERMQRGVAQLTLLNAAMREDRLFKKDLKEAFINLQEHVQEAHDARSQALGQLAQNRNQAQLVSRAQTQAVAKLEKDIIYLDDLLAVSKLDELKGTAKDLLSAQRSLQDMLSKYKQTQDPAMKAQLQERIADLRQRMMELLAKMGDIKKGLPGEYRNMESAQMLRLDDDLNRLEKTLKEGNLDKAAAELEQLANMVENMVDRIDNAQDEYGGERYEGVREQLKTFADAFKNLESEQKQISQMSQEMLQAYRKKAMEQVGSDLEKFVKKAREQVTEGLQALDRISQTRESAALADHYADAARQGLHDLDTLLAHQDFAEALQSARSAAGNADALVDRLAVVAERMSGPAGEATQKAAKDAGKLAKNSHAVQDMLEKLFPDAKQVLGEEKAAQMQRLAKKQQSLEQQARELAAKMDQLSQELPVFGGAPKASLDGARGEMAQAARDIGQGQLPDGAGHGRRAAEQLGKLRESLEQASGQGGGKGLPMPLGEGGGGQGQGSGMEADGGQEVEIPKFDRNARGPKFRQDLLEAAKQKSPSHFEEAVRRYYEELIR